MTKILHIAICLTMITSNLFAQKPLYETTEDITMAATTELDELMRDSDFLKILDKEGVEGTYHFQITVKEKGQITSMRFLEKSEDASVHGQNFMNNLVKKHKFGFKVPKGNFYKFEYTFIIPQPILK